MLTPRCAEWRQQLDGMLRTTDEMLSLWDDPAPAPPPGPDLLCTVALVYHPSC
jgi:hypothetical protein